MRPEHRSGSLFTAVHGGFNDELKALDAMKALDYFAETKTGEELGAFKSTFLTTRHNQFFRWLLFLLYAQPRSEVPENDVPD